MGSCEPGKSNNREPKNDYQRRADPSESMSAIVLVLDGPAAVEKTSQDVLYTRVQSVTSLLPAPPHPPLRYFMLVYKQVGASHGGRHFLCAPIIMQKYCLNID